MFFTVTLVIDSTPALMEFAHCSLSFDKRIITEFQSQLHLNLIIQIAFRTIFFIDIALGFVQVASL